MAELITVALIALAGVLLGGVATFWIILRTLEDERGLARELRVDEMQEAKEANQYHVLQDYYDKMSDLILYHELLSRGTAEGEASRSIATARTLVTLEELLGSGKGSLLKFLNESGLIGDRHPLVSLRHANLSRADMSFAYLRDVNLSGVYLSFANLTGTDLTRADLSGANLSYADLTGVDLTEADLSDANLSGADLSRATYNNNTKWPYGFDPKRNGAINIDDNFPSAIRARESRRP